MGVIAMDINEMQTTTENQEGLDIGYKIMVAVVLLVVLVGGYFVFRPQPTPASIKSTDEGGTISPAATAPVFAAGYIYTVGDLQWVFEPQAIDEAGAPTTRVRLRLHDFRRDQQPIEVGLYRLGTYRGVCAAQSDADRARITGALAALRCSHEGNDRELAVFQEEDRLIVKARATHGAGTEAFAPILTIDIAEIVETSN